MLPFPTTSWSEDDQVLTIQWRLDRERGVALVLCGKDGTAWLSVKRPGGHYATAGEELKLGGSLDGLLRDALIELVASAQMSKSVPSIEQPQARGASSKKPSPPQTC